MLPKDIITIIDAYNEKGVIIHYPHEAKWFNGYRFETVKKQAKNATFIKIELQNKLHSYILDFDGIDHFDGIKWSHFRYLDLHIHVDAGDYGTNYYTISYGHMYKYEIYSHGRNSLFHGILHHDVLNKYFVIDHYGNLSFTWLPICITVMHQTRITLPCFKCSRFE